MFYIIAGVAVQRKPGSVLLSRGLSQSTIGAGRFHFRVRDGIGCWDVRHNHQTIAEQRQPYIQYHLLFLLSSYFLSQNANQA